MSNGKPSDMVKRTLSISNSRWFLVEKKSRGTLVITLENHYKARLKIKKNDHISKCPNEEFKLECLNPNPRPRRLDLLLLTPPTQAKPMVRLIGEGTHLTITEEDLILCISWKGERGEPGFSNLDILSADSVKCSLGRRCQPRVTTWAVDGPGQITKPFIIKKVSNNPISL